MAVKDILLGLSNANGPSGAEGSAARLAMELLSDFTPVVRDSLGNVIAELGDLNAARHILIDAHIDEIGLVVTAIDDNGFLHFAPCGGVDRRVLMGSEVSVMTRQKLSGIVCCRPPHLTVGEDVGKVPAFKDMAVDIGYGADKARELVPIGTRIAMKGRPAALLGSRVSGKALDNRAGAAAIIRTVELLEPKCARLDCHVTALLSTREEVGHLAASCAAFSVAPTEAVAVDVGFAAYPGCPDEECGKLGAGPMIGFSSVLSRAISKKLTEVADREGIAWQYDVMGGKTGTNADDIAVTAGGIPTGLISIPERSMHTPVEVVDCDDVERTAQLLAAYIKSGGIQ
ncbi:MAG: M42 family peptidase [Clostridia bacterium]|nr:M42 family peptidase [Clostridia bacterium]